MSRRYSREDLIKLRASPLVSKPASLPPNEEWMGVQETTTKRPATRGRQDDGSQQMEGYQKRSAFEPSQRKPDPERIVLGPPRRSFASSNGKPIGKSTSQEPDDIARERTHERNKTGEELENKFGERKGFGAGPNRHLNRHEHDGTAHDRSRRRFDDEDGDSRTQRDYERNKWSSKENRDDKALEEDVENGNNRSGLRRGQGRSKFEQPWFRNDRASEESRQDTDRNGGWRQNRVKDGDWDLPGKGDADPEWMDTVDNSESFQVRTQEDFQRWKERMKAGTSAVETKAEQPIQSHESRTTTGTSLNPPAATPSLISPDPSGNSMDKFFARFNEKKSSGEDKPAEKPATKTRFASFFGPQAETKHDNPPVQNAPTQDPLVSLLRGEIKPDPRPMQASPAQDPLMSLLRGDGKLDLRPVQDSPAPDPLTALLHGPSKNASSAANKIPADADQAGFQRILQMLGKREPGAAAPAELQKSSTPGIASSSSHQRHASPDLVALFKQDHSGRQPSTNQAPVAPPGFERLIDSRSPANNPPQHPGMPTKDDLLLNLLRQADISAKPQPPAPYQELIGPQGILRTVDQTRSDNRLAAEQERPEMQERGSARSLFDDPAISSLSYPEHLQRRPQNALPPGFENAYMDTQRPVPAQGKQMHSMPPGLQRPPGLDQMPRGPPGWNHQPPSQGPPPPQGRPGPPPGLGPRGMPLFGNPSQPPMPSQLPGQGPARPPAQRKHTGDSNMPAFPPGIGPPGGYMGHGPPPGFQHASAAQAAQNYGRFAMGGNEQPPLQQGFPPPGIGRGFLDLFGGERDGMRGPGGVPLPPGFR